MTKDNYWTVGEGTRSEVRVKRCGICGNTQTRPVGARFGPCPYKALHAGRTPAPKRRGAK